LIGGKRKAQNPLNLADVRDASYIGLFVQGPGTAYPTGYGFPGSVLNTTPGFPTSLRNSQGLLYAPRLGFAWDPFRDGKTAVRGGAGVFLNNREGGGTLGDYSLIAPIAFNASQSFGTLSTYPFSGACPSSPCFAPFGPQATRVLQQNRPMQSIFNATLGIQRRVPWGMVVDVAYVGTWGRHLTQQLNLNANSYGTNFNPANKDSSQTPKTFFLPGGGSVTQQVALPGNFLVPTQGYGSIDLRSYGGTSNYNSLQAQLTKRMSKGLEFGAVWTWSKAMDFANSGQTSANDATVANFLPLRFWNYGEASFDRTQNVVFHFLWDVPKASHLWNNAFVRGVFDDWQYSGITELVSGAPMTISTTSKTGAGFPDFTGGGDGTRFLVTGNPILPKSKRSIYGFFNPSVFIEPPVGTFANPNIPTLATPGLIGRWVFRGPGTNNFDMALEKNIPIKERVKLKLRGEAYNVFNHPSFDGVNTQVQFNTGSASVVPFVIPSSNTNPSGWVNSERQARIMQLSARISF
jgi:hypothetical protein